MAQEQSTSVAVHRNRAFDQKPEILMCTTRQSLHMWHGLSGPAEIKAIWRNEIGPSLDPTPQITG